MSYQVHNSRRIVPHGRKRKERGDEGLSRGFRQQPSPAPTAKPPTAQLAPSSNRLLAGYMAFEYLTRGTLLGQKYNDSAEPKKKPIEAEPVNRYGKLEGPGSGSGGGGSQHSYEEVARLLKTEGTHIPGIVNPTQLARWIQM